MIGWVAIFAGCILCGVGTGIVLITLHIFRSEERRIDLFVAGILIALVCLIITIFALGIGAIVHGVRT